MKKYKIISINNTAQVEGESFDYDYHKKYIGKIGDEVKHNYRSENWKDMIAGSKFKGMTDFGKVMKGHIALQDHGNKVWFRNIKIRKL